MPDDEPALPPHESKRIKVMADYRCDPLWALDEERYGCFAPEMIDLSPELTADLNAWAGRLTTPRSNPRRSGQRPLERRAATPRTPPKGAASPGA